MKVEVEVPVEFQGGVSGDLASRRGLINGTDVKSGIVTIEAEVPLANMFGYSTDLRSLTQGRGNFSMEFACYRRMPGSLQEEIIAKAQKDKEKAASKK
jgi:elongation factor G